MTEVFNLQLEEVEEVVAPGVWFWVGVGAGAATAGGLIWLSVAVLT